MKLRSLIYQSVLWRGIYFASVLLLNIMIARYYEASYSGLIYFITNSFALIVAISSLSMESGVAYYTASGEVPVSRLANFSVWWTLFSTLAVFIVLNTTIHFGLLPESYTQQLFPVVCYVAGCMLVNFFTAAFYAKKNFALPNMVLALVNIALVIIIPFSNGALFNFETYIKIYFAGFFLQGLLTAILFYTKYGKPTFFHLPVKSDLTKIIKYSMTAFAANFLFFLVYRIDYWFVEYYCSATALGNYIQVSKLAQTLFILPSIIASAVFPSIVNAMEKDLAKKIAIVSRFLLLLYLGICLVLAACGYWLFPFVFGKTFSEMFIPFLLLIPGILALVMLYPVAAFYAGVKKININIAALLIALLVIVAGNFIFTPKYGIKGAAMVSSAGYLVYHFLLTYRFTRYTNISAVRFYSISISDISKIKQMIFHKFLKRS
ncbi:MAG: polysaccharide biosynthesis C-terminal domain-containing protein [Agriterribacter sp.]